MLNPIQEYKKETQRYTTEAEIMALHTVFDTSVLVSYFHEMDNGFIDTSFGKTVHNLRSRDCQLLGIAQAPWTHQGNNLAIIYENIETYERCWVHINQRILDWWLEQT